MVKQKNGLLKKATTHYFYDLDKLTTNEITFFSRLYNTISNSILIIKITP